MLTLEEQLKQLEESLLHPDVPNSEQEVASLLADEFLEFGSSGKVYDKKQVLEALKVENAEQMTMTEFKAVPLSPDIILTTYRVNRLNTGTQQESSSLRSSIWKFLENRWQMVFHQGTPSKSS